MRPTDEDQPGSRRPNLMSSTRRPGGEINILAMLEGRSGRKLARRLPALPAAAWYASAGLLVCALAGAVAWVAHDGGDTARHDAGGAADSPPQVAARDAATMDAAAPAADAPVTAAGDAHAAAYGAHAATDDAHAAAPPPSTLHAGASHMTPAPAPPSPTDADRPGLPAPGGSGAGSASGHAAIVDLADAARAAASAATVAPSPTAAPMHAANTPARPASARAAGTAKNTASHPAVASRTPPPGRALAQQRTRRPATAKPAAAPVDMDVALISAIIQHAGRPGEAADGDGAARGDVRGRAGATCAGGACGPRMPDQP